MKEMKCTNCGALLHVQAEQEEVQCPNCSFVNRLQYMNTKVKMADGALPYIFVSYCHKDMDTVIPVIQAMQKCGYRVWYDEYIQKGEEWPDFVQRMEIGCQFFVCFMSDNYVDSDHCRDEVHLAKAEQKKILILEIQKNVEYRKGLALQIGSRQKVPVFNYKDMHALMVELNSIKMLQNCKSAGECNPQSLNNLKDKPVINNKKENRGGGRKIMRWMIAFICVIAVIASIVSLSNRNHDDEDTPGNDATLANISEKETDDAITTTESKNQSDITSDDAREDTQATTITPTTQSTDSIELNFLDVCEPYQYDNCEARVGGVRFNMAGNEYTNGIIQTYSSNGRFISNLGKKFDELYFTVGHVDDSAMCDFTVDIYLDNNLVDTFDIKSTDLPKDITISLSGYSQLIIEWRAPHKNYQDGCRIGFANMVITEAYNNPADEQETEQDTNQALKNFMDVCEPYQYDNCEARVGGVRFNMAGNEYTNGIIQTYSSNGRFISNLGKKFDELYFTVGHVDDSAMCDFTVDIYLDNNLVDTFDIKSTDLPKDITISLSGYSQLIIEWRAPHKNYQDGCRIGFANMIVS